MLAEIFLLKIESRIRIENPQPRNGLSDPRFVPFTLPHMVTRR